MRILVTGGAGFIGSHVADGYVNLGHEVAVLDDLSRGYRANVNRKARFYHGDICDRGFIGKVLAEFRPEAVNHHAAQMDVRRGVREPIFDAQVNIVGSLNLLEEAVANKVRHFVYSSSAGAAYGEPNELPVSEDLPVNPITPYGISKHTVEHYLFTFRHLYALSYAVLRYGNVYGPRQNSAGEAGVFAIFCEQTLSGKQPIIYGNGSKTRDYVYIEDVVKANILALVRGSGEIFNIASQRPITDLEVFTLVAKLLGKPHSKPRFADIRAGEIEHITLDISKARRMLGWRPEVSLAEGAERTVAYFREQAGIGGRAIA
jgi:UDP-glucose 4-epimerase